MQCASLQPGAPLFAVLQFFKFASTHDFLGQRFLRGKTGSKCDLVLKCAKMDGFLKRSCQNGDGRGPYTTL